MAVNACCCNWNNQQGTVMILQFTMIFAIYSVLRELVDFAITPWSGKEFWKIGYCSISSLSEIFLAFHGICGIKDMKPSYLLPIAVYKAIYIVLYTFIIIALPIQTFLPNNELIALFKHHFNIGVNPKAKNFSPVWMAFTIIFSSTLLLPMEQLVKLPSVDLVVLIYTTYLCFVDVFQTYFVVVICLSYRELMEENERLQTRRSIMQTIPTSSGQETLTSVDIGLDLPQAIQVLPTYVYQTDDLFDSSMNEELNRQRTVPNASALPLPLGIN